MPISSSEIASLNGAYLGQHMNNQAFSGMIGQQPGYYGGGGAGDRMMGGAMNRGSAVGGPAMMGAMGMMGLDPMSLGLKAGLGAFSGGAGVGGSLAAGAMAAAPAAIALAGVAYMGNQAMSGAQGQMQLNNNLRSSFNFQNQHGGQGFNRSDMTQVGGMLRSMTEQFGPGGEVTNFKELSQLTAKMGQMGLAQGVKDVQEFGKKFKEMVTTLKTMAKDLGTTLEGAMEFASAAKGSGIFGMTGASKFAGMARSTAISGGLAMSEVTGAASIGSQISRSMGGLGRQGAMAGMKTIGQIGTAQQMGVLSEEDIYNVTGQTGAEGRQAYAASSMQRTAGFLQSGRGRRVLASMAGKDGTLNEDSVQQLLSGGMSISETMKRDQENLGKIGRANFIRNEGRLRGAAMEKFGAFLPGLQMMQWANSKGVDINNMDDRSMLFAQRQLGMGRDEVDQAVKMANEMPAIMAKQRASKENDLFGQAFAQKNKQIGIEGIKTRFAQAQESINGKLQKMGQDMFNEGSDMLEGFFNKLTGKYVQVMHEEADKVYRDAMGGGEASKKLFDSYFGAAPSRLAAGQDTSPTSTLPGAQFAAFNKGNSGEGILSYLGPASDRSKFEKAGFQFGEVDKLPIQQQDDAFQAQLKEFSQMAAATSRAPSEDLLAFGKSNSKWMNDFYATQANGFEGADRVDAIRAKIIGETALADPDSVEGKMRTKLQGASRVEAAAMVAGMEGEGGANISSASRLGAHMELPELNPFAKEGVGTMQERNLNARDAVFGERTETARKMGDLLGGALKFVPEVNIWGRLADKTFGDKDEGLAIGATMLTDTYKRSVAGVFSSDDKTRDEARLGVQQELQSLSGQSGKEIEGRRAALQGLLASEEYSKGGRTQAGAEEALTKYGAFAKAAEGGGGTAQEKLERAFRGQGQNYAALQKEVILDESKRRRAIGETEQKNLKNMGIATFDGDNIILGKATAEALASIPGGEALVKTAFGATAKEAALNVTDQSVARAGMNGALGDYREFHKLLDSGSYSVAQQRVIASSIAGSREGAEIAEHASGQDKLEKNIKRGGVFYAAARSLGVSLSKKERSETGGNITKESAVILQKLGLGEANEEVQKGLKEYLYSAHQGKTAEAQTKLKDWKGSEGYKKLEAEAKDKTDTARDPFGKQTVEALGKMPGLIATALTGVVLHISEKGPEAPPVGTATVHGHGKK